jgi:hypothetical protein
LCCILLQLEISPGCASPRQSTGRTSAPFGFAPRWNQVFLPAAAQSGSVLSFSRRALFDLVVSVFAASCSSTRFCSVAAACSFFFGLTLQRFPFLKSSFSAGEKQDKFVFL